jgi:hypothetical protein
MVWLEAKTNIKQAKYLTNITMDITWTKKVPFLIAVVANVRGGTLLEQRVLCG